MTETKRILIAEDDDFIRTLLDVQCKSLGLQTHCVINGEQLVTEALSYNYDIILTDIQMPVCDGIEAMQILRQLGYDRPIFAMSADIITQQGFDEIIQKPVDETQLAALCLDTPLQFRVPLQVSEELTALFYRNLTQLQAEFSQALQDEDFEHMRQICHKIKGGAASFGHNDLSQIANELQIQLANHHTGAAVLQRCQQFLNVIDAAGSAYERT